MKKLISFILIFTLALSLMACGKDLDGNINANQGNLTDSVGGITTDPNDQNPTPTDPSDKSEKEYKKITFGGYYAYKNGLTDKSLEPIEWYVLAEEDGKMLICTVDAIMASSHHSKYEGVTWETSSIRQKLNKEFYDIAFTDTEKAQICTSRLDNGQTGATEDKVFLLSSEEVGQYMTEDIAKNCRTWECVEKYTRIKTYGDENYCDWWLRDNGDKVEYIKFQSHMYDIAQGSANGLYGVRPAMWITAQN